VRLPALLLETQEPTVIKLLARSDEPTLSTQLCQMGQPPGKNHKNNRGLTQIKADKVATANGHE